MGKIFSPKNSFSGKVVTLFKFVTLKANGQRVKISI